jgi:tetratricopeptide (TPR) repeat protein
LKLFPNNFIFFLRRVFSPVASVLPRKSLVFAFSLLHFCLGSLLSALFSDRFNSSRKISQYDKLTTDYTTDEQQLVAKICKRLEKRDRYPKQSDACANSDNPKPFIQDEFQSGVNKRVRDFGRKFEGKGRNLLYGLRRLPFLALLVGILFYAWNRRSGATAQTALGKAIETSQAQVSASPAPAGFTGKMFKTEKERSEAAINEFQAVVDKFSGETEEKAKYFIAVNRLNLDRAAAIQELEGLSKSSGEIGTLSKFALAQAKAADGKNDEAVALYQELAGASNAIIAKDTINFELAQIYQKQGKTNEAADIYYNIAKTASEAKGLDEKPIPMSQTAREAKEKLEEINPERAKEIVEPAPESPLGGMPIGM